MIKRLKRKTVATAVVKVCSFNTIRPRASNKSIGIGHLLGNWQLEFSTNKIYVKEVNALQMNKYLAGSVLVEDIMQ